MTYTVYAIFGVLVVIGVLSLIFIKADKVLFKIKYYSLTKKYFPMYREDYMNKELTGIVSTTRWIETADSFKTEEEAREFIILFKEQQLKENIEVIKVD